MSILIQAFGVVSFGTLNTPFLRFLTHINLTAVVFLKYNNISPSLDFLIHEFHAVSELIVQLHKQSPVGSVAGVL